MGKQGGGFVKGVPNYSWNQLQQLHDPEWDI